MLRRHKAQIGVIAGGAIVLAALALAAVRLQNQTILVGQRYPADSLRPVDEISHEPWDELLGRYVRDGEVDYRAWHVSDRDRRALEAYLAQLSRADLQRPASREGVLAFWINAYNAVTVAGILREYPTPSIRRFTPTWWGYHIWHDLRLQVGPRSYSLSEIEHEQLRPMGDPRIHFAIVCASRGCPPLRNEAYRPERLEAQLEDQAKTFFADSRHFRYSATARQIELSQIFEWFPEDFGADQAERLRTLSPWLPTDEARKVASDPEVTTRYLPYDWGLNERTSEETERDDYGTPRGE